MFEHAVVERIEQRLTLIDAKLDHLVMTTGQNILDALQVATQSEQNFQTAVQALATHATTQPAGVLDAAQADAALATITRLGTNFQDGADQLNALIQAAQPAA